LMLLALRHYGLLTDDLLEQFSEETRQKIEALNSM